MAWQARRRPDAPVVAGLPAEVGVAPGDVVAVPLTDRSGAYADGSGEGSSVTARLALEDHGGSASGNPVEPANEFGLAAGGRRFFGPVFIEADVRSVGAGVIAGLTVASPFDSRQSARAEPPLPRGECPPVR